MDVHDRWMSHEQQLDAFLSHATHCLLGTPIGRYARTAVLDRSALSGEGVALSRYW
jgi:hypothetical protein